jgi:hypothetical protein
MSGLFVICLIRAIAGWVIAKKGELERGETNVLALSMQAVILVAIGWLLLVLGNNWI